MFNFIGLIVGVFSFAAASSEECTPVERAWETKKFAHCQKELYRNWCFSKPNPSSSGADMNAFYKKFDPDNFQEDDPCSGHKSSCDFLEFLTATCGAEYSSCHTGEEKKDIIRFWTKQLVRETTKNPEIFEDNSTEILRGECNDIFEEYFKQDEIDMILDMIGTPIPREDRTLHKRRSGLPYNYLTNITYHLFGIVVDENGDRIGAHTVKSQIQNPKKDDYYTIPSHWEYCSWQLSDKFLLRSGKLVKLINILPDFFHCDGKCNSNKGDDQLWYRTQLGVGGIYLDRNTQEVEREQYMGDLISTGIHDCYLNEKHDYSSSTCQRFENFVHNCSSSISQCLGDVGIKEMVMGEFLTDLTNSNFDYQECGADPLSGGADVTVHTSSYFIQILVLAVIINSYVM